MRPSFSIRASPSKHNGLYIVAPHPRGPGKTFPIRSQLQANDVIVIISGAIARNVGHQVMKLQESIRRHAVACNVVHFLPGKINILRVYVRRRCSLLKRDYLPTLDRAPNAKTRATETLASCITRGFPFLSPSLYWFIEIFVVPFFFFLFFPSFLSLFRLSLPPITFFSLLFLFFFE